jgi:DNA-binding MarR family transcriptional regulator
LPKPNDKRATYIILTAKGADLLYKYPPTLQEKLSKRLKKLTPEKVEELNKNIELLTLIMDVEDMDAAPLLTIEEITSHTD